jgi:hypothetical protein
VAKQRLRRVEDNQDRDDAEPEGRGREAGNREGADNQINPAILLQGRDRAERDRDRDRDNGRHERDLERDREAGRDLHDDRLPGPHRLAEIEPRQAPQEIEELHDPRPIDADFGVAGGERRLGEAGAAGAQAHEANVARNQAHQQKHQRRRPD